MSVQIITEQELAASGVSSLPLTPTASPALGGRDYTPGEVKAAFDRLPRLIAARLNALLGAVTDGALLADIPVAFGEANVSLSDLLSLLTEHLQNPPVSDSAPTSESENTVTSGGVYTALENLRDEVLATAASNASASIAAQKLTYDAATGEVTLAQNRGGTAFTAAALPFPELSETIALLRTLLGASVLSETVEDTYNTRVTAGGLPVVDDAPATVHAIKGATAPTVNLLDESLFMPVTISDTGYTKNLAFTIAAGTYTVSTRLTDGSVVNNALAILLQNSEGTNVVDCNVGSGNKVGVANTFTVTEEQAQSISTLRIYFNTGASGKKVDYFMLNAGETALPHEAYYAGLKSAAFAGITSTGRNLLHFDTSDSARLYIDVSNPLFRVGNGVKILADRKMMVVKVFRYQGSQDWGEVIFGADFSATPVASKTFTVKNDPNLAYKYIFQIKFEDSAEYWATREEMLNAHLMLVPSDSTLTIGDYTPYCADASFAPAAPVTLGKWDHIDVDAQKMVVGTATLTQETPFTDEQLAQYADYVLSADGKTIAYESATTTRTAVTLPKTYKAWRGGCEYITADASGGQNPDHLKITVTGDYYVKAGGEEA